MNFELLAKWCRHYTLFSAPSNLLIHEFNICIQQIECQLCAWHFLGTRDPEVIKAKSLPEWSLHSGVTRSRTVRMLTSALANVAAMGM